MRIIRAKYFNLDTIAVAGVCNDNDALLRNYGALLRN